MLSHKKSMMNCILMEVDNYCPSFIAVHKWYLADARFQFLMMLW